MAGLFTAFTDIANAVRLKTGASGDMTPSEIATAISGISGGLEGGIAHNSIYRGKNLGTSVTAEQYASIADGTFSDLYIGDYWVIGDNEWRIAAFDYFLGKGDTECITHHVIVVPDRMVGATKKIEDTNITTNGYGGSKMRSDYISEAKGIIETNFGASHILKYRDYLTSASSNGFPSSRAYYDAEIELMSERMVYGSTVYAATSPEFSGATTVNADPANNREMPLSQFPLFTYDRSKILCWNAGKTARQLYWLRDVVSATHFASVTSNGNASNGSANNNDGVRPCFGIVG